MLEPYISIIIPAYNEELSLGYVLEDVNRVLGKTDIIYEIIVVNDGSQDDTAKIASGFEVILINNENNMGKGSSLLKGFRLAKGKFIITMDADGSHRAEDIITLLNPLIKNKNLAATIGSRFLDHRGIKSTSRMHIIGNEIIDFLIMFLTGKLISDSQCGFRVFRKSSLKKLRIHSTGFGIEGEMIIQLLKNGSNILEVPILCYPRRNGLTRMNSFRDGFNIIKTIILTAFYCYFTN